MAFIGIIKTINSYSLQLNDKIRKTDTIKLSKKALIIVIYNNKKRIG